MVNWWESPETDKAPAKTECPNAIPVEKPSIFQRFKNKLNLYQALPPIPFKLRFDVQPTTNFDELFKEYWIVKLNHFARTAASGTGYVLAATVPKGERRTYFAFSITNTTGDGQINMIVLTKDDTNFCPIFYQSPAGNVNTQLLNQPVVVGEHWKIYVNVDSISTDSEWDIIGYYALENNYESW